MIKKFNLFENNNNNNNNVLDVGDLMISFSIKNCIKGMLYLLQTTDIDPDSNLGDGLTVLTMLDEYERYIKNDEMLFLIDLVKLVIDKGGDINKIDNDFKPPLLLTNDKSIIKILLDADCNINLTIQNEPLLEYDPSLKKIIKEEYPDKYKKYQRWLKRIKFNL